jgi:subtilisin family serine protease
MINVPPFQLVNSYDGKDYVFDIKQNSLFVKAKYDTLSNTIHSNKNNETFIKDIQLLSRDLEEYKVTFNQKIADTDLKVLNDTFAFQKIGFVYTFKKKEYFGKASLIIKSKYPISENEILKVIKVTHQEAFIQTNLINEFFLIQYNDEIATYNNYNRIKENPPDWMESVNENLFTYDTVVPKTPPINVRLDEVSTLSIQKAYNITNINEAHLHFKGNKSIKIGVFDCGIDFNHPDLSTSVSQTLGYDYVQNDDITTPYVLNSHATCCAGIIGGVKKYSRGVDGVAKGCTIVDYRIGYSFGSKDLKIDLFDIICAFYKATFKDKVHVINCSWGINVGFSTLASMIRKVTSEGRKSLGTVVVFSAGNKGICTPFPGNMNEVITVSAIDKCGSPKLNTENSSWKTNHGPEVDIAAPGTYLVTTVVRMKQNNKVRGYTEKFSGTSAATPIVSGCIGLMLSLKPKLKATRIKSILKNPKNTIPFSTIQHKNYGVGIINVHAVLKDC